MRNLLEKPKITQDITLKMQPSYTRRYLTKAYIFALSLIALLSISAYLFENHIMTQQYKNAEKVNVAGRQRMLSQRISWLVMEDISRNSNTNHIIVTDLLKQMQVAHEALSKGNLKWSDDSPLKDEFEAHYFQNSKSLSVSYDNFSPSLDEEAKEFFAAVRNYLSATNSVERNRYFSQMEVLSKQPLLSKLHQAVHLFQLNGEKQVASLLNFAAFILITTLMVLLAEAFFIFRPAINRISKQREELLELAQTDPLTGCYNRRMFGSISVKMMENNKRQKAQSALFAIDIDHFKAVNDTYGHAAGDEAIRHVVRTILATIREGDLMGRMGGEEFSCYLSSINAEDSLKLANKIRLAVESSHATFNDIPIHLTISIGISIVRESDIQMQAVSERADEALYTAKNNGRNQCILHSDINAV